MGQRAEMGRRGLDLRRVFLVFETPVNNLGSEGKPPTRDTKIGLLDQSLCHELAHRAGNARIEGIKQNACCGCI